MATLLDLKSRTLSYLRRMPGDASIPDSLLEDAINRARRDEWRRCGGPVPDTTTMTIVAGRRDYPVAGPVCNVAAKTSPNGAVRRLVRQSPTQILRRWPDLTAPDVTQGEPMYWTMRPVGDPTSVEPTVYRAITGETILPSGVLSISLWPIPAKTVTDGLVIDSAGPATDLSCDSDVSELPESVDTTACYKAALELTAFIGHEPEALALARYLEARAIDAGRAAFNEMMQLLCGSDSLGPAAWISDDLPYIEGRVGTSRQYEVSHAMEKRVYTVSVTGAAQSIPCSPEPAADGTVIAISSQQGVIPNATINGSNVDVIADGGMTFYAGDKIIVLYEAQQ